MKVVKGMDLFFLTKLNAFQVYLFHSVHLIEQSRNLLLWLKIFLAKTVNVIFTNYNAFLVVGFSGFRIYFDKDILQGAFNNLY